MCVFVCLINCPHFPYKRSFNYLRSRVMCTFNSNITAHVCVGLSPFICSPWWIFSTCIISLYCASLNVPTSMCLQDNVCVVILHDLLIWSPSAESCLQRTVLITKWDTRHVSLTSQTQMCSQKKGNVFYCVL